MMDYIIPLISQFLSTGLFTFALLPVISLAIVATIPCIIRSFVRCR